MKEKEFQNLVPRKPRQKRAQEKVALILEAAMRLLDKGGLASLTTNAVAETAGVSIGTLYQYFANKDAILDALAEREMAELSQRVWSALKDQAEISTAQRIVHIIHAVTSSYGGRPHIHRIVMEHSLAAGGGRLTPLIGRLVAFLTAEGRLADDGRRTPFSHADAFVLTNAFAGVMRAMILWRDESSPPQDQIEDALVRLMVGFTGHQPIPA